MKSFRFLPAMRHPRWVQIWAAAAVLAVGLVGFSLLTSVATPVSAAPATQCNGEMNGGGTEVACTITVVNYLTEAGTLSATPPSTLTMTRCVGATGPLSTLTCTTTTDTLTAPVTTVQQCNGSGNGGGGAVICTVTVTNHFTGNRDVISAATTFATVYQCVGSEITGTGAPGTCTPVNTAGVTSVTAATVGQCNGSGNGGTSVGFVCIVTAGSTVTASLPVNIDQCNDSANGGGALMTCQATVVNDVIATAATPTPTVSPTVVATAVPTVAPTPVSVPTPAPTVVSTPVGVPTPAPTVAPRPAATGNGGLAEDGRSSVPLWPAGLFAIGVAILAVAARVPIRARTER